MLGCEIIMVNFKAGLIVSVVGIVIMFIGVLFQTIFLPQINDNLLTLKDTSYGAVCTNGTVTVDCCSAESVTTQECTDEQNKNATLLQGQKILFQFPLFTIIGGLLIVLFGGPLVAYLMGKKN